MQFSKISVVIDIQLCKENKNGYWIVLLWMGQFPCSNCVSIELVQNGRTEEQAGPRSTQDPGADGSQVALVRTCYDPLWYFSWNRKDAARVSWQVLAFYKSEDESVFLGRWLWGWNELSVDDTTTVPVPAQHPVYPGLLSYNLGGSGHAHYRSNSRPCEAAASHPSTCPSTALSLTNVLTQDLAKMHSHFGFLFSFLLGDGGRKKENANKLWQVASKRFSSSACKAKAWYPTATNYFHVSPS